MRKWVCFLLALVLGAALLGCDSEETTATPEECWAALNGQGHVRMNGDFQEANQATSIFVDDVSCGYLQESGLLNTKWTVSIQGKDRFYVTYVTDGIADRQDVVCGTTFGFYDTSDACLGYAQEQLSQSGAYRWMFLDPSGADQGIWAVENCTELYDDTGALLAKASADYSYSGDLCTVTIDCVGGRDVPVYAKFLLYEELLTDAKTLHG